MNALAKVREGSRGATTAMALVQDIATFVDNTAYTLNWIVDAVGTPTGRPGTFLAGPAQNP